MTDQVRDLYNKLGRRYLEKRRNSAASFWNDQIEAPAMMDMLKELVARKDTLDAGCGSGDMVAAISKISRSCIGIDQSKTMIEIAKECHPGHKFQVEPIEAMTFKDETFDIVWSSLVLHYFQSLTEVFKSVARVLRPRGNYLFSIHHPFAETFVENRSQEFPFKVGKYFHQDKYIWPMAGMDLECFHHTFESIAAAAFKAGFVIEMIQEPRPSMESQQVNPRGFLETRDYPKFCLFKLRKQS